MPNNETYMYLHLQVCIVSGVTSPPLESAQNASNSNYFNVDAITMAVQQQRFDACGQYVQ